MLSTRKIRLHKASGMPGGPYCYIYDGNGLRVAKKSGANSDCTGGTIVKLYWRSIAGDALAETDGTGSTTNAVYNEYAFFAGRRIAQRNGSGGIFYYFADQVGSTRTVTTGSGTGQTPGQLCYDADFSPYGQEISYTGRLQTTACPPNYKFTGYERDPETGLDYAFARYYSARLGRFLSTDPIGGAIGDLQSHNAYAYVENNPANAVDPSGLRCFVVVLGIITNNGTYDSIVPPSAANYPYNGEGLLASLGSVFSQSLFGPNSGTQGFANFLNQYSNEPGGVDIFAISGGAQRVSTSIQSGLVSTNNIASITYLSPGVGPFGSLAKVGDTKSYHGSGIKDFFATLFTRLGGGNVGQSVAQGHNFPNEFQSSPVQRRLQRLEGFPTPCPDSFGVANGISLIGMDFISIPYITDPSEWIPNGAE